jgi:MoaA/NifB/PqqE/SkfB family radical SAM enzyme
MELSFSDTFLGHLEQLRYRRSGEEVDMVQPPRVEALVASYCDDYPYVSPLYGYLKVVRSCNSRCVYCDHWTLPAGSDPTTTEIQNLIDSLHRLGVRHINLTGGEPLLRSDIPTLIEYAHTRDMIVCLLTNGLLLPRMADALLQAEIDAIILSLDSVIPAELAATRGVPFESVEKGFRALVAIKQERPETFVSLTSVITRVNLASLGALVEYAGQYGVGVQFSPYHHFDPALPDELTPDNPAAVRAAIAQLLAARSAGHLVLDSPRFLEHFPDFFLARSVPDRFHCLAGYVAVFVDVDLHVRPCWMMAPVGDLRQLPLDAIWYGAQFQEARQRIRMLRCRKCWLLCTAEPSLHVEAD